VDKSAKKHSPAVLMGTMFEKVKDKQKQNGKTERIKNSA